MPIVAVVSAVLWSWAAYETVAAKAGNFARAGVPGELTVQAHPDTWYIYAEYGVTIREITVTDPSGKPVTVTSASAGSYDRGGTTARSAGKFMVRPGEGGSFRIAVTGTDPSGSGTFAVGNFSVNGFLRPHQWGISALLLGNMGSSLAIAFVPIVRRRRGRVATGSVTVS